jgi:hypothetical protein
LPPAGEKPMTGDSGPNSLTLEDPLTRIEGKINAVLCRAA